MEQSSFSKIMKVLQISYPYYFKNLDEETSLAFVQLYYSKLKKYRYEIVAKAIDNLITTSEFMPTIAEVIKECDKQFKNYYRDILEKMYKDNYFKNDNEYGKAIMWLLEDKPIIPNWLMNDINTFIDTKTNKYIKGV